LSFNQLSEENVAVLAALPSLKKLDLSENGLRTFPSVIKNMNDWWSPASSESKIPGFLNLEYLNLDGNLISNDSFFDAISVIPK
jgi:Leucine-rich repeat (LRR) protein